MIYTIVYVIFKVYYVLLILRVIMSWVSFGNNFFTRFIYETTEPLLGLIRRIIPPRPSFPLDFSPIIAYVLLQLLESLIIRIIMAL